MDFAIFAFWEVSGQDFFFLGFLGRFQYRTPHFHRSSPDPDSLLAENVFFSRFLPFFNFRFLPLWDSGTLRLWDSETVELWDSEILRLWSSETLELWDSQTLRLCGTLKTKFLFTSRMRGAKNRGSREKFLYVFCGSKAPKLPTTLVTRILDFDPTPLPWRIFREGPHLPQIIVVVVVGIIIRSWWLWRL